MSAPSPIAWDFALSCGPRALARVAPVGPWDAAQLLLDVQRARGVEPDGATCDACDLVAALGRLGLAAEPWSTDRGHVAPLAPAGTVTTPSEPRSAIRLAGPARPLDAAEFVPVGEFWERDGTWLLVSPGHVTARRAGLSHGINDPAAPIVVAYRILNPGATP